MIRFAGVFQALGILVLLRVLAVALAAGGAYWYLAPQFPSAETLREVLDSPEVRRVYLGA